MSENSGKVYLVGAGPGDVGLLTLKGRAVLASADVVVYDALVGPAILALIPETAEAVNVGKRSSSHTMPQESISELLVQKAREGRQVVRLKGGDPFLFGRGGEEIELLAREGIAYEVVPGITSAVAVPAYQGIPVTHRDFCSSVHIVTGHKRAGESYDIDFEALVRTRGTLVFLMGVASLGAICRGLMDAGMDPAMPAALLMQGTTASQGRIVATVATLETAVEARGARTPAIIVVGKVCSLADEFEWYDRLPLGGVRVVLTRPRHLAGETAGRLRALGAEVLELPAICTRRIPENERLHQALDQIEAYQWLVFTSPTGVRVFFEELAKQRFDLRRLGGVRIAVIGTGTQRELEKHGLYADLMPELYDGAHLGAALYEACADGDRILIARASMGNRELTDVLAGQGNRELTEVSGPHGKQAPADVFTPNGNQEPTTAFALGGDPAPAVALAKEAQKRLQVDDLAIYDTTYERCVIDSVRSVVETGNFDYAMFTSASTVRGFAAAAGELDFTQVKAVCIGKQTCAAAEALGMRTFTAERAAIDSLIARLVEVHGADVE